MNRSQKGVTLIEVLVSIAVFAIISLALFSTVFTMKNVIARQEEYVKLEMVCYDMGEYYNKQQREWYKNYFSIESVNGNYGQGYLDSNFKPTDKNNASYIVDFNVDGVISIYSKDNKITYVENVKLGEVTNEE